MAAKTLVRMALSTNDYDGNVTLAHKYFYGRAQLPANDHDVILSHKQFYGRAQLVTGLVCYPILCILGLFGNFLSIHVFSKKRFRSSTTTYLIAMAVSDIVKLLGDSVYVIVTLLLLVQEPLGQKAYAYLYPYAHYILKIAVGATAWSIVCVATERYIMVCWPARARTISTEFRAKVSVRGVKTICLLMWVYVVREIFAN